VAKTDGVTFQLKGPPACEYTLKTCQSFEIAELIKYYKCLSETVVELANNPTVINKAKGDQRKFKGDRSPSEKPEGENMANFRNYLSEVAV
jgi:hypothetical protein